MRTFEQWMEQVDAALDRTVGVTTQDLPDQPYADWFARRIDPMTAARRARRYAEEG